MFLILALRYLWNHFNFIVLSLRIDLMVFPCPRQRFLFAYAFHTPAQRLRTPCTASGASFGRPCALPAKFWHRVASVGRSLAKTCRESFVIAFKFQSNLNTPLACAPIAKLLQSLKTARVYELRFASPLLYFILCFG